MVWNVHKSSLLAQTKKVVRRDPTMQGLLKKLRKLVIEYYRIHAPAQTSKTRKVLLCKIYSIHRMGLITTHGLFLALKWHASTIFSRRLKKKKQACCSAVVNLTTQRKRSTDDLFSLPWKVRICLNEPSAKPNCYKQSLVIPDYPLYFHCYISIAFS